MDDQEIAEAQRLARRKTIQHNYRILRPIFKAAPKNERAEMKRAYRLGPSYYLFKWLQVGAPLSQPAQSNQIGV